MQCRCSFLVSRVSYSILVLLKLSQVKEQFFVFLISDLSWTNTVKFSKNLLEYCGTVQLLQKFLNAYSRFLYLPHCGHTLKSTPLSRIPFSLPVSGCMEVKFVSSHLVLTNLQKELSLPLFFPYNGVQ